MYYYITEAPRSREEQRALERARELLTNLGISGEFVSTSPARSVEELAELGVAKRYSTIVAVGSEKLINQVAALLAGTPYVFGALPLTNPAALELVTGITTLEEAAEALKYRRVRLASIARIEPNKFFLTETRIQVSHPIPVRLTTDQAVAELECTQIRLAGSGVILLENAYATGGRSTQFLNWLTGRKPPTEIYHSRFHGERIVLETEGTYPVYLGSDVLAKTPLAVEVLPNTLKIVTRRDRLATQEEATPKGGTNSRP